MADLGVRVSELRAARELTQEQLAEAARLSNRQMQRVEAGEANLSLEKLVSLAVALDVPTRDLFALPAKPRTPRPGRPPKR